MVARIYLVPAGAGWCREHLLAFLSWEMHHRDETKETEDAGPPAATGDGRRAIAGDERRRRERGNGATVKRWRVRREGRGERRGERERSRRRCTEHRVA